MEQYSNKELQVEVIDVFPEKNSVWIENENASGEYEVQAPASIRFAKQGPATIKFNGAGQICYIRSNAPKSNFNTYKKPFGQARGPAQPFQKANTYQPKESVDWDKIAFGKVRHGVAIEAIKKDMPLNEETKEWIDNWTKYIVSGE
jgi:hypothetical protein